MPLKTLIILGAIAIISVGMAYILVAKGYIRIGVPESAAPQQVEAEKEKEVASAKEAPQDNESPAPKKEGEGQNQPSMEVIPIETIIVNLKGSFGRRYLKVSVNLGVKDAKAKETIDIKKVEIKDRLISLFSTKTIDDVDGWSDQDMIRAEIKEMLNRDLKLNDGIEKVFFTEFVAQ